jgi:hypothetical protein
MPRPAVLLLVLLAAGAEEEVCEDSSKAAAAVRRAEKLVAEARQATDLRSSSAGLIEATTAYKEALGWPGVNKTHVWSEVGLLHMDFYLAVGEMSAETGMPQDRLLHTHMKEA